MWPYFTYNNISYNLRKGPILYLPSTHSALWKITTMLEESLSLIFQTLLFLLLVCFYNNTDRSSF